jgi:hypothetical protein
MTLAAAMLSMAAAQADEHLTEWHMRELVAFGINADMGFAVRPEHIKAPDTMESVYRTVASAMGSIGQPCLEVVHIEPPESGSLYDVVCRIQPDSDRTVAYTVNTVALIAKTR